MRVRSQVFSPQLMCRPRYFYEQNQDEGRYSRRMITRPAEQGAPPPPPKNIYKPNSPQICHSGFRQDSSSAFSIQYCHNPFAKAIHDNSRRLLILNYVFSSCFGSQQCSRRHLVSCLVITINIQIILIPSYRVGLAKKSELFFFFQIDAARVHDFRSQLLQLIPLVTTTAQAQNDRQSISQNKRSTTENAQPPPLLKMSSVNISFSQKGLTLVSCTI